ncbi:MAG: hypothetical protein ACW981_19460 [Candidatus Hodarchaeales archaeon]
MIVIKINQRVNKNLPDLVENVNRFKNKKIFYMKNMDINPNRTSLLNNDFNEICKTCFSEFEKEDNYCFNCGKHLRMMRLSNQNRKFI